MKRTRSCPDLKQNPLSFTPDLKQNKANYTPDLKQNSIFAKNSKGYV